MQVRTTVTASVAAIALLTAAGCAVTWGQCREHRQGCQRRDGSQERDCSSAFGGPDGESY